MCPVELPFDRLILLSPIMYTINHAQSTRDSIEMVKTVYCDIRVVDDIGLRERASDGPKCEGTNQDYPGHQEEDEPYEFRHE